MINKEKQIAIDFMNWSMTGDCYWVCTDEDQWELTGVFGDKKKPGRTTITTSELFDIYVKQINDDESLDIEKKIDPNLIELSIHERLKIGWKLGEDFQTSYLSEMSMLHGDEGANKVFNEFNVPKYKRINGEIVRPLSKDIEEIFEKPLRDPCTFCGMRHIELPCDEEIEYIKGIML